MKHNCIKCKKSGQTVTCHGCQRVFCKQHVHEHKEELSHRMDGIGEELRQFEDEFNKDDIIQPYLSRVDQWERESINRIQRAARQARDDLSKILDRMKTHLKSSVDKIANDIQFTRQSNDYSEMDLNKWTEQLKHLRHIQQTSLTENIIEHGRSPMSLIKVIDEQQAFSIDGLQPFPPEKFEKTTKQIARSADGRTVTCLEPDWNGTTVCGNNLYVSGIHSIRFRITKKGQQNPFFGIVSTLKEPNPWKCTTPLAYGWWKIPWTTTKENKKSKEDYTIRTGDELTLTVNCTNNEIDLENHRTKQNTYERIAYEQCPFPWKIAIVLYSPGDSISILS